MLGWLSSCSCVARREGGWGEAGEGRGAAGGQGRLEKIGLVEVVAVVEVERLCWLIRITLVTGGGAQAGGR